MKLIRYGDPGREEPGVILDDGRQLDTAGQFSDYDEAFFAFGGMEALRAWVEDGCPDAEEIPPEELEAPPPAVEPYEPEPTPEQEDLQRT